MADPPINRSPSNASDRLVTFAIVVVLAAELCRAVSRPLHV